MKFIEGENLELKQKVVDDVRKTIVAFANTDGGTIYIGIAETDGDNFENMRSINQELSFEFAKKEFDMRNIPFSDTQYKTLKLVNEDGIYTNLALLLSEQCIHTIKAAVFEGKDKTIFKDRREFSGSILKQLNDVFNYISQYNRIRSEFSGLLRIDSRDYPEEAVREALLNSLVHRDYSYRASTLLSIFDDRIEFVSVGGLVKGISMEDIMLGVSVTRNEKLANIFYRLQLIEAFGTGVPKIMKSYDNFTIKPTFEASDNAFKITLANKNINMNNSSLSEQDKKVLNLVEERTQIVRKDVENLFNVSQTMAGRILKRLVNEKILVRKGNGKNTSYVLKK